MIRSIIIVLAVFASNVANAEADNYPSDDDPIGDVNITRNDASRDGWVLRIDLHDSRDQSEKGFAQWAIEAFSMERSIGIWQIDGVTTDLPIPRGSVNEGEFVMIVAKPDLAPGACYCYLQRSGDFLEEVKLEKYLDGRSVSVGTDRVFEGHSWQMPPREGHEKLLPWEDSDIPPEDQAWARQQVFGEDAAVEHREGALTAVSAQSGATNEDTASQGCDAGPVTAATIISFPLLLVFRRRRGSATLGAILLTSFVGTSYESHATVVSGYASFWDSRGGSNVTGTRLYCDTTVLTCTVNSTNCCLRGIPGLTVTIAKKSFPTSVPVLTVEANLNGYFVFPDYTYPAGTYELYVTYTRSNAPTYQVLTTSSSGTTPFLSYIEQSTPQPTGASDPLGALSVNALGETGSQEGNIAAAWHAVTYSFIYMEVDTETRQRKVLGSANTYDQIIFRYLEDPALSPCPSTATFTPGQSRTTIMHEKAGLILIDRVVGCTNDYWGNAVTAWPSVFWASQSSGGSTAESAALNYGIRRLIALMSRFSPSTATVANVKAGFPISCVDESGYANSNSAAWYANNALALWELLDTSTLDNDEGVSDNVDTRLDVIMTALSDSYNNHGSSGTNHTFEEFYGITYDTNLCSTNESCTVGGAACLADVGKCFKKRATTAANPHGGNIGDLIYRLPGGIGNSVNTVKSSMCIHGDPDDSYPFQGSYRDN